MLPGKSYLYLLFGIFGVYSHRLPHGKPQFQKVYEWSQLEFSYSDDAARQADIDSGTFQEGQITPIDVDVHHADDGNTTIFITIPRFQEGVPVTLGTVTDELREGNPLIAPYPSWSWHQNPEECRPERLVSVFRVMIDECDRLFVLDNGVIMDTPVCPPQILIFNLTTDKLIHKYEIPPSQVGSKTLFVTPVVDVRDADDQCKDTFVYAADTLDFSLIVYDVAKNTSWKVSDNSMYPYPNYGDYSISGVQFSLMDGILGASLTPNIPGNDRKLFYHAMSSPTENWVYTSHLRNQSRFTENPASSPEIFKTYSGQRKSQSAAEAIDKNGILYQGLIGSNKIACFNTKGNYGSARSTDIVADNPSTLQFASGMKVIENQEGGGESLWLMSVSFQKVATGTLDSSEINFRILMADTENLVERTSCKGGYRAHRHWYW